MLHPLTRSWKRPMKSLISGVHSRDLIGEILRIKRLWTFHRKAAPGSLTPCHSHAPLTSALNTCHRFRGSIQSPPRNSSHDRSHLIAGQKFGRFDRQINLTYEQPTIRDQSPDSSQYLAPAPLGENRLGRHKDLRVELDSQQVPLHPEVLLCHPCPLQLFPTTQAPTSDIELGASARTLLWLRVRRSVSAVSWPANHGRASVFRYPGQKPWQGLRGPRK
jgi:hypothetical protein